MAFKNENVASGQRANAPFQVGKSDKDDLKTFERGVTFPWLSDPAGSYLYYDCKITVMLDNGIVVHNTLPQVDSTPDTLASIDYADPRLDREIKKGVNLKSNDRYTDIQQRMAHSRYWFNLTGVAIRVGYQIPIPGIKSVGGVEAIPIDGDGSEERRQWAYNTLVPLANFGGIPIWKAEWSLWYTTLVAPTTNSITVANPSAHISGTDPLPDGMQVPVSRPDSNATTGAPQTPRNITTLTNSLASKPSK